MLFQNFKKNRNKSYFFYYFFSYMVILALNKPSINIIIKTPFLIYKQSLIVFLRRILENLKLL